MLSIPVPPARHSLLEDAEVALLCFQHTCLPSQEAAQRLEKGNPTHPSGLMLSDTSPYRAALCTTSTQGELAAGAPGLSSL